MDLTEMPWRRRVCVCALLLAACDQEPPTEEQISELHVRTRAIAAEVAGLTGHPWAGTYSKGFVWPPFVSLSIAPDAGMTYSESGCMGLYDLGWGRVVAKDESLSLEPELRPWFPFPEELIVVPWGERVYLIEPEEIEEFTLAVRSGREPTRGIPGDFLMREGDWDLPVSGEPEVPNKR